MAKPTEKSLAVAIGLNVVWPGAGYLYYGRVVLGIILMIIVPILALVSMGAFLVLFWIVMVIDLVILNNKNKKEVEAATTKKCPNCAELIKLEARVCRYCNTQF